MTGEAGPGTVPLTPSDTELVMGEVMKEGGVVPRGYEPKDCGTRDIPPPPLAQVLYPPSHPTTGALGEEPQQSGTRDNYTEVDPLRESP